MKRKSNITKRDRDLFNALTSGKFNNFALFSCFVNGKPSVAIIAVNPDDANEQYNLTPLFVKPTPDMVLTDHEGRKA